MMTNRSLQLNVHYRRVLLVLAITGVLALTGCAATRTEAPSAPAGMATATGSQTTSQTMPAIPTPANSKETATATTQAATNNQTITTASTTTLAPTRLPTPRPTAAATTTTAAVSADRVTLAEGFYYCALDVDIQTRIIGLSYPADVASCKITFAELRYLRLLHYDFDGVIHEGELIVNALLADEVLEIFYQLYKAHYPLTSVRLVDDFGEPADDTKSMEANNTSAFCYRYVTGTSTLSRHSYGAAIDINPMFNPYIDGDRIAPENGAPYVDRTLDFPGKIDHDDLCYQLFKAQGWSWGGDWSGDKDYQHFSKKLDDLG